MHTALRQLHGSLLRSRSFCRHARQRSSPQRLLKTEPDSFPTLSQLDSGLYFLEGIYPAANISVRRPLQSQPSLHRCLAWDDNGMIGIC